MAGISAGATRLCTAGRKRVSLSQLCGGRVRAGSVRMPAAFSYGGACGVAAVCRRPVKDPPRQFGERAFTGLLWMMRPGWSNVGLCGGIWGCVCSVEEIGSILTVCSTSILVSAGFKIFKRAFFSGCARWNPERSVAPFGDVAPALVNQAEHLFDGAQIHVPLPQPAPANAAVLLGSRSPVCRATTPPGAAGSPRNAPSSGLISGNAATLERHITLTGIGTQIRRPALGLLSELISAWGISATFLSMYWKYVRGLCRFPIRTDCNPGVSALNVICYASFIFPVPVLCQRETWGARAASPI